MLVDLFSQCDPSNIMGTESARFSEYSDNQIVILFHATANPSALMFIDTPPLGPNY